MSNNNKRRLEAKDMKIERRCSLSFVPDVPCEVLGILPFNRGKLKDGPGSEIRKFMIIITSI